MVLIIDCLRHANQIFRKMGLSVLGMVLLLQILLLGEARDDVLRVPLADMARTAKLGDPSASIAIFNNSARGSGIFWRPVPNDGSTSPLGLGKTVNATLEVTLTFGELAHDADVLVQLEQTSGCSVFERPHLCREPNTSGLFECWTGHSIADSFWICFEDPLDSLNLPKASDTSDNDLHPGCITTAPNGQPHAWRLTANTLTVHIAPRELCALATALVVYLPSSPEVARYAPRFYGEDFSLAIACAAALVLFRVAVLWGLARRRASRLQALISADPGTAAAARMFINGSTDTAASLPPLYAASLLRMRVGSVLIGVGSCLVFVGVAPFLRHMLGSGPLPILGPFPFWLVLVPPGATRSRDLERGFSVGVGTC